jgi:hypothetical protein
MPQHDREIPEKQDTLDEAAKEKALGRLRQAYPEELALPGGQDQMVRDARKAGAGWDEIVEAVDTHPRPT